MLDLILAGPGVTPDLVCDLADEFMAGEVLTRPNAARFCGLSPMTARSIARRLADDESIDVLEVKAGLSVWDFRVICLDMDGTVIQNECIDDMAALHGVGEEVSSVTRAAMEGGTKLTFAESLEKRVAFLRDAPVSVIDEALASVRLQPGAARLIDFCNADSATNKWAAKRAAMGHIEPFNLEYLGIGNEDLIDDVFKNRFQQIFDAVKAAHPEITVVGTVGPAPSGQDYEQGWAYAREAGIPIVDEHSYQSSSWWFHNLDHYDHTDRKGPKVYLGEYGSWDTQLINGLSEAAFMGRMELNGDVVHMASYAPLFAKNGHTSWNPDLIYFDNENVYRPYSYWVQQMYATTTADTAWPVSLDGPTMLRRDLPNTVSLKIDGGAHADFADFSLETADGTHIDLPDVSYQGNGPVSLPVPEGLAADSYTIRAKVTYYEGMWGVRIASGDVNGKNYNGTSLGRGFSVQVVREGTGYALAGTETSMDAVRPGTTWDVRIEIGDRGEQMRLYIDGALVADGHETPDEPRRTVTVSRDSTAGVTYLRVVNALPESVDVDLAQVLAALNVSDSAKAVVEATVLTGNDPYAGIRGEESPTCPTSHEVNLADGTYTAPAWSFTTLAVRG